MWRCSRPFAGVRVTCIQIGRIRYRYGSSTGILSSVFTLAVLYKPPLFASSDDPRKNRLNSLFLCVEHRIVFKHHEATGAYSLAKKAYLYNVSAELTVQLLDRRVKSSTSSTRYRLLRVESSSFRQARRHNALSIDSIQREKTSFQLELGRYVMQDR